MNSPNKKKPQEPVKVKILTPQSLLLGVPLLVIYLIMAFITGSWREGLFAQVVGSIRLLILSLGIFLTFTGTLGFIIYPEDRHRLRLRRKKRSE